AAQESGVLRRVLDQVERLLVEIHLHEHVAGEKFAGGRALLSLHQLDDGVGRDEDVPELLVERSLANAIEQRELGLVLVARIGVYDVPLHRHKATLESIIGGTSL